MEGISRLEVLKDDLIGIEVVKILVKNHLKQRKLACQIKTNEFYISLIINFLNKIIFTK